VIVECRRTQQADAVAELSHFDWHIAVDGEGALGDDDFGTFDELWIIDDHAATEYDFGGTVEMEHVDESGANGFAFFVHQAQRQGVSSGGSLGDVVPLHAIWGGKCVEYTIAVLAHGSSGAAGKSWAGSCVFP
jgi:hypothetical protein